MMTLRLTRLTVICAAVAAFWAVPVRANGAADAAQQACINALNKDGAKVAATQGKGNTACIKNAGKGKLPSGQIPDQCLTADAKGKVSKAAAKTEADFDNKCAGNPPSFGVPAGSAAAVNEAAISGSLALLGDVFGASLDAAVIGCDADKNACKCQQTISKDYEKVAATAFKEFLKCKKNALKGGAMTAGELASCVSDPQLAGSIAADSKGKIQKAIGKLGSDIVKKCESAGILSRVGAPGLCSELSGAALGECIGRRVDCRACLTLNMIDGLTVDCDAFDDGSVNGSCAAEISGQTIDIASAAAPPNTPGSPGVSVTNPNLVTQFGTADIDLNKARYVRYRANVEGLTPDATLVLVPGFQGGANDFDILADHLIVRAAAAYQLVLEVWAFDRRTNQLEDTTGAEIATELSDPNIALDWYFGDDLGLPLSPALAADLNRRAIFHNAQDDVAFIANWTPLVFSRDIDAVVKEALSMTRNGNVFLGGHSAGTGFTARYAATDFNLTGSGTADPGYARLRGLVLLEGSGGSVNDTPVSEDTLDRIEAKFDGALFAAVRDAEGRCVDGTTACTIATEASDCGGTSLPKCAEPTLSYAVLPGLVEPQTFAALEAIAIQASNDLNSGQIILQIDQGEPGNNAIAKVPELAPLALIPPTTAAGGIGVFIDDDGLVEALAPQLATSVGAPGPAVGGLLTWQDITQVPLPESVLPDNGPAPTSLPSSQWGQEAEIVRIDRFLAAAIAGESNLLDWYYPSSGLGTTVVSGVCTDGVCAVGDVGAACAEDGDCSQSLGLDSSALSIGRGRPDIENLTQAAAIDLPVIAFGATNGLVTTPGRFVPFAESIGSCAAPSCDGTVRVVDPTSPNEAFPTFGSVSGGFEVHMSEGLAHVDVTVAEDRAENEVPGPLVAFLARNAQGFPLPAEFLAADGINGGRMYDKFWATETGFDQGDPRLATFNASSDFFRCKQCHAWDRLGNAASYIDRAPKTTRPNVSDVSLAEIAPTLTAQELFDRIKVGSDAPRRSVDSDLSTFDPTDPELSAVGDQMPDYGEILTDEQIWDLVKYLKEEVLHSSALYEIDTSGTYPTGSKAFSDWGRGGDPVIGNALYADRCGGCHGANGTALLIEEEFSVGSHLRAKPYETWHKVKFGTLGTIMGAQGINTLEDMRNLYTALAIAALYPDPE